MFTIRKLLLIIMLAILLVLKIPTKLVAQVLLQENSSGTLQMEKDMVIDTLQQADVTSRIEYKQLATLKKLREADLKYNQWSI